MKSLRLLFAAVCTVAAVSCEKAVTSQEIDNPSIGSVAYNFDFNIASRGISQNTKADATIGWTEGEKVFVFFKPEGGSLLENCLTMTYVGRGMWQTSTSINYGSLGTSGKLSAVYVPYISDDTVPTFNDGTWTLDGDDVYYSFASNVDYIVSGSSVTAIIDMNIPDGYVQFGIDRNVVKDGDVLACNLFDSYECVSLDSDMTFREVATDNQLMTGHDYGDYCWFYGKRNDTNADNCEWNLIRGDMSFGKTVESSLVSKNNSYILKGFLPDGALSGLFSISPTKKVHFSKGNLVSFRQGEGDSATYTFGFENNQYDYRWRSVQIESMQYRQFVGIDVGYCIDGVVDKVSRAPENTSGAFVYPNQSEYYYSGNIYESGFIEGDERNHCGIDSPNHGVTIDDKDTWRSLTAEEWGYLLGLSEQRYHPTTEFRDNCQSLRKNSRIYLGGPEQFVRGIVVAPDDYDFTAHPLKDSYSLSEWVEAEKKYSLAFLPGESVPGLYWCAPECYMADGVGVYALGIDPTESDFISGDSLAFVPLRYRVAAFVRLFTPYPEDNWD